MSVFKFYKMLKILAVAISGIFSSQEKSRNCQMCPTIMVVANKHYNFIFFGFSGRMIKMVL